MPGVTDQARKTEGLVESAEQVDVPAVKEALRELERLITAAAAAPAFELALPAEIVKTLSGKRIALAGFSEPEARRIGQVLDRAECFTLVIESAFRRSLDGPGGAVRHRHTESGGAAGSTCDKNTSPGLNKPVLLVGSRAMYIRRSCFD